MDEVSYYKHKYRAEVIVFNDNTLNLDRERFLALCRDMELIRLPWSAAIRCDNFDEEMAVAAKQAGASYFIVGVESFQQKRLDMMQKRVTVEEVKRTLELLDRHKLDYHANVLVGFENDTLEDIVDEVALAASYRKVYPAFVQPFTGLKVGKKRNITRYQHEQLQAMFTSHMKRGGKTPLPVAA